MEWLLEYHHIPPSKWYHFSGGTQRFQMHPGGRICTLRKTLGCRANPHLSLSSLVNEEFAIENGHRNS